MKVSIVKSVVIITAQFSVEDVKFLQSVEPAALELRSQDGVLFAATIGEPSISNYGISLHEKRDIVLQFDKPVTEEMVKQAYPSAFLRLPMLEQQIQSAVEHFRREMEAVEFETLAE